MPYPIFIKHTIGIIHPAVEWRVMINRTILIPIGGIKRIGEFEFVPCDILHRRHLAQALAIGLVPYMYGQHKALAIECRKIHRHIIINFSFGSQSKHYGSNDTTIFNHLHSVLGSSFLNRDKQVALLSAHANEHVSHTRTSKMYSFSCHSTHAYQRHQCHHQFSHVFHNLYVF